MNRFLLPFVVIPCLLMASYGQAATLYQLDHFQYDTTTLDWSGYKESYTGPPQLKP